MTATMKRISDLLPSADLVKISGREYVIAPLDEFRTQFDRHGEEKLELLESLIGILPRTATLEEARAERLAKYEAGL